VIPLSELRRRPVSHRRNGMRSAGRAWRRAVALGAAFSLVTSARLAQAQQTSPIDSAAVAALHDAIQRVNPELAARRAALAAAEARLRASGFAAPVVLSAEIEEVPSGLDVTNAGSSRLELSREFLAGGVRGARRAIAAADVERARVVLDVTERRLRARTDQFLTRAVAAAAIAQRLGAEDSLLTGAEEGLRVRFAVGDASYVSVLRLRTERLRVQTDRAAAQTEARIGRRALLALLTPADTAEPVPTALVDSAIARLLTAPLGTPLPPVPDVDSLVALSGAVRLARIDLTRSEAGRRLVRAEQRPQIAAVLGAQRFGTEDGRYTVGPTVGLSISLPFTARRANQTSLIVAEREMDVAHAQQRAAVVATRAELAAAQDRYEAVRERLALYDAALLRGAREERETALAAYRSAELSLLELLDFERALARAEIAQLQGRIDAANALADLLAGAAEVADEIGGSDDAFALHSEVVR
jgi:cobalt-zinc-cadmium efflux system outer membrane protein